MAKSSVRQPRVKVVTSLDKVLNGVSGVMNSTKGEKQPEMMSAAVMRGVTAGWLAQVFRMDLGTVKARLRDCPPIDTRKNGYIYDLKVAAQYLVKPVFNIEEYLKTMKVEELPTRLQDQYWSAMNKRQKYEENAGDLWRTAKVQQVLGEVFMLIRNSTMLWVGELERNVEVTEEQRVKLEILTEELMRDINNSIRTNLKRKTRAQISELDEETKKKPESPQAEPDEEDDDDYSDLI